MFPNLFFHSKIYWDRLEREKKEKEEREKAEKKEDVDISRISMYSNILGMTWFLDVIQIYGKHSNWIIL